MSDQRKHPANLCTSDDNPEPKGGTVQKNTVEKWIKENDKGIETSIWLKFETSTVDCDLFACFNYLCGLPEYAVIDEEFHLNIIILKVRLMFACLTSRNILSLKSINVL